MTLRRPTWPDLLLCVCFLVGCDNIPVSPQHVVHYSGRVMDSKGRPIPEGRLLFNATTGLASRLPSNDLAEVDSSGSFRVDLYPGTYHVNWVPPYFGHIYYDYEATDRTIEVSAKQTTLDWIVDGVVVQGGMKDPSGAAVDSFGVYILDDRYDAFTSTRSGHYELFLAPGTYTFLAYGQYGSGIPSQSFGPISVQSDTTLDFQIEGFEITGTVRGPGSLPLVSAAVEARGPNTAAAMSDGTGRYRMYLPPQDVRFLVRPAETWIFPQLTTSMAITSPTSMNFDLGGTEWTGIVTRSDTGAPFADARVYATAFADGLQREARATTDASGQFRLALETGLDFDLFAAMGSMRSARISRVAGADTSFALEIIVPSP